MAEEARWGNEREDKGGRDRKWNRKKKRYGEEEWRGRSAHR